jgi:NAD(P)-dependent dehydrogenase (short-subunit alcohol dehydrogenase family)
MTEPRPNLAGKVALVTGASDRIGRAIALALAAQGAAVAVHYHRDAPAAAITADQVRAAGSRAALLQADLARPGQGTELVARAVAALGPLDILINNASIFRESTLADFDAAALAEAMQIHALALVETSRAFAAQGRPGDIVNLLDARIVDYDRRHVAYHLSKRAARDLTCMCALDYAPAIRVNAVAPGLILPPEGQDESWLQKLAHTAPLQRYGSPRDITDAVLFLLAAPFVTGQTIFVDGGRHLRGDFYG